MAQKINQKQFGTKYSTDEQLTGDVWIDGKSIFKKTFSWSVTGGGGGGGANAGNLHLRGAELDYDTATLSLSGGTGGPGGSGYQAGASGTNGADGVLHVTSIIPAQPYPGPFYRVWDGTEWIYASGKVRGSTAFKETKAEVL